MKKLIDYVKAMPRYAKVMLLISFSIQVGSYYITMLFARGEARVLTSALDEQIPLIPAFSYIYLAAFPFWVWGLAMAYCDSRKLCVRVFTADVLSKVVCILVFCLYPCTMKRPADADITGMGAWLLKIIYFFDGGEHPMNLLPSMHCYLSVMMCIPLFSRFAEKPVKRGIKVFFCVFALFICASTLFVKQHVLVDVATGVPLAPLCWWASLLIWKICDAGKAKQLPEGGN
ncbi:MAG: phosphatase PAP2 family protein [Clostridiales bacterium]|nr:phosphatase PAP2 family protein [Clostridiales bacterium]